MSLDPTMAIIYAQSGYTARVVHEAASAPQTAGAMARVMTEELLRQEQSQVQRTAKGDEARVGGDAGQSPGQMPFGSRRRNRNTMPTSDANSAQDESLSPLVGNFLNVKV